MHVVVVRWLLIKIEDHGLLCGAWTPLVAFGGTAARPDGLSVTNRDITPVRAALGGYSSSGGRPLPWPMKSSKVEEARLLASKAGHAAVFGSVSSPGVTGLRVGATVRRERVVVAGKP